jgi:RNA polymerase sigma-70 factor (ECF subfamily)
MAGSMTDAGRTPPPAFAALYERCADAVLRYCLARIGNPVEAEDAAATIFSRALAAWPPDDPEAARSWLFAIAHNVVANHYRAIGLRAPAQPLEEARALPDRSASPEEIAIRHEDQATLLAAVAELSSEQRQVVELRLAGLTGRELAETMGRSHAAVKMLQYRAIQNLRAILALAEANPAAIGGRPGKETSHGN